MKKFIITSIIFCATCSIILSQVSFDIKVGLSPGANPTSSGIIVNRNDPLNMFEFNLAHVKPQFYGGVSAHLELSVPFSLECGISYTRRTSIYSLSHQMATIEPSGQEMYMSESEDMIQIPLDIGVSLGPIDVTSGLRVMKSVSDINDMSSLKGFHADQNAMRCGWQMGIRYGFKRTLVGIEYQGTLNRVGYGMYVNGKSLELMNVPGRFVFSLQYRL